MSGLGRHLPAGAPRQVGCYGSACRQSAGIGWPAAADPERAYASRQKVAAKQPTADSVEETLYIAEIGERNLSQPRGGDRDLRTVAGLVHQMRVRKTARAHCLPDLGRLHGAYRGHLLQRCLRGRPRPAATRRHAGGERKPAPGRLYRQRQPGRPQPLAPVTGTRRARRASAAAARPQRLRRAPQRRRARLPAP